MKSNINFEEFTDKQKVVFLTTSIKNLTSTLRKTQEIKEGLEKENEKLKDNLAKCRMKRDELVERNKDFVKKNEDLRKELRSIKTSKSKS